MDGKEMVFLPVEQADVGVLGEIMRRSFDADSRMHTGQDGGPPDYGEGFIRRWAFDAQASAHKIVLDGQAIGAVLLFFDRDKRVGTLGALFLDPEVRGQGVGAEVWRRVEAMYPQVRVWRTETIWYSHYNHYFYVTKCGFQIVRIERLQGNEGAQYFMEKRMG